MENGQQQDFIDEDDLAERQGYDPDDQIQIKDDIESDERGFDEEPEDADFQISQTQTKLDDQIQIADVAMDQDAFEQD